MKFEEFNLRPSLATTLKNMTFENCTPIQDSVIPLIIDGKDVFGLAQTGTGKTGAFLLPTMERILCGRENLENIPEVERELLQKRAFPKWEKTHFVLVLTPTRELAEQITQDVERFGAGSGLTATAIYGGSSYENQKAMLAKGVEFVVGTPGRLIDLYKSHTLDLKQVRSVIFDEADRMFDMGFKEDMLYLLQRIPRDRQMLMFSATLNFDVLTTAYQFGSEPVEVDVSRDQAKAENVKDGIYHVGHDEKPKFILSLLKKLQPKQTIIFSNFKYNVERIARFLTDNGHPAMGISSLLTQAQRNRVIEQFKAENESNILVATDVAARGLDIKGVDMVINYELPDDAENYVHRIGRTGRAGQEGTAVSFVSDRDVDAFKRIEDYLKHKLDVLWMDESELIKDFKPFRADEYRQDRPAFASSKSASEFRKGGAGGGGRGAPRGGPAQSSGRGGGPRTEGRGGRDNFKRDDRNEGRGERPRSASSPTPRGDRATGREQGPRRPSATGGTAAHTSTPHAHTHTPARAPAAGKTPHAQPNGKHPAGHKQHAGAGPAANAGRKAGAPSGKNRSRSRPSENKRPHRNPKAAPAPTKGVTSKVSGFFKRLFGGE